jgi:hypothetical protein
MQKRLLLPLFFGFFLSTHLAAQTNEKSDLDILAEKAAKLRDTAQKSDLSYKLLSSLTTQVGARHPGTPGEAAGIEWAMKELKQLGFDKVYKEQFSMKGWLRKSENASVTSPSPQDLVITALGYSTSTPENGLEAEVVQFESYEALEKAQDNSLNGKIVFINRRMNKARDGLWPRGSRS